MEEVRISEMSAMQLTMAQSHNPEAGVTLEQNRSESWDIQYSKLDGKVL